MQTFVVRIWTPADDLDDPERFRLRGRVEHVHSGEQGTFRGAGELLTFLEARLKPESHDTNRRTRGLGRN